MVVLNPMNAGRDEGEGVYNRFPIVVPVLAKYEILISFFFIYNNFLEYVLILFFK
jgi:hypothetical protein